MTHSESKKVLNPEIIGHTLFLVLYTLFAIYGRGEAWNTLSNGVSFIIFGAPIVLFYGFAFIVFPRFLKQRRWAGFLVLSVGLIGCVGTTYALIIWQFGDATGPDAFLSFANKWDLIFVNFCGLGLITSFGYWFTRDWLMTTKALSRLEAERLSLELAFLKSQFNPHFVFNSLNTVYSMAIEENSPQTAASVSKLSGLMRYNLEQAQQVRIPLSAEIDYLKQYIELQELRLTAHTRVELDVDHVSDSSHQIAPAILQTFLENAFKYGVSAMRDTSIEVSARLEGQIFRFDVRNTIVTSPIVISPIETSQGAESRNGLGLANAKKRLEIEYPGRHSLVCQEDDGSFLVTLELQLNA